MVGSSFIWDRSGERWAVRPLQLHPDQHRLRLQQHAEPVEDHALQVARQFGDLLGGVDADLESVDDKLTVSRLLLRLPARERRMLAMRFYGNRTQAEIAAELRMMFECGKPQERFDSAEAGDEIITSPLTFAATANAARYLGASVKFVDVQRAAAQLRCP